tara:strand:+ start:176 stop:367 length:192 start_codon:yes stop_codon:yes gene_type:complete
MASPRKRRLKKMLRAGLLKAQEAVEAIVEKVAPKEDEAPLVVEEPVVKKEEPKAKKAAKKKAN